MVLQASSFRSGNEDATEFWNDPADVSIGVDTEKAVLFPHLM